MFEMPENKGWKLSIAKESGLATVNNNIIASGSDRELLTPFWPWDRQDCDGSPGGRAVYWHTEGNFKGFKLHSGTPNLSFPLSHTEYRGKVMLNSIVDGLSPTKAPYLHEVTKSKPVSANCPYCREWGHIEKLCPKQDEERQKRRSKKY